MATDTKQMAFPSIVQLDNEYWAERESVLLIALAKRAKQIGTSEALRFTPNETEFPDSVVVNDRDVILMDDPHTTHGKGYLEVEWQGWSKPRTSRRFTRHALDLGCISWGQQFDPLPQVQSSHLTDFQNMRINQMRHRARFMPWEVLEVRGKPGYGNKVYVIINHAERGIVAVPVLTDGYGIGMRWINAANDRYWDTTVMRLEVLLDFQATALAAALPRSIQPYSPPAPQPDTAPHCTICGAEGATQDYDGEPVCTLCHSDIYNYNDRRESRIERLEARAEKLRGESRARWERARELAGMIPFGQPILVGHHSEKRHRAHVQKIETNSRKGHEIGKQADRAASRAHAAKKNRAVSSDDPLAVVKLREKLAKLEASHEQVKRVNKAIRKAAKMPDGERVAWLAAELDVSEQRAADWLEPDFSGRVGVPAYVLTNSNAEMRRIKQRIEKLLEQNQQRHDEPEDEVHGEIRLERDFNANRLRLHFPGKPEKHVRDMLKSCGFKWSRSNMAWQRQLTDAAEWDARRVIEYVNGDNA